MLLSNPNRIHFYALHNQNTHADSTIDPQLSTIYCQLKKKILNSILAQICT